MSKYKPPKMAGLSFWFHLTTANESQQWYPHKTNKQRVTYTSHGQFVARHVQHRHSPTAGPKEKTTQNLGMCAKGEPPKSVASCWFPLKPKKHFLRMVASTKYAHLHASPISLSLSLSLSLYTYIYICSVSEACRPLWISGCS